MTKMERANLPPAALELLQRFENRQARVGILGLGYVGLPLAVALAKAGLQVTGIDLDPAKVDSLSRGESYIEDVPSADVARLVPRTEEIVISDATPEAGRRTDS